MKPSSTRLFTATLSIISIGIAIFALTTLSFSSCEQKNEVKKLPDHLHSFIVTDDPEEM